MSRVRVREPASVVSRFLFADAWGTNSTVTKLHLIAAGCAALAGFALAAQSGVNGALKLRMTHPLHASLISFTVGFSTLLLLCLVGTRSLPRPSAILAGPWWTLTGGMLGCVVVTTSLLMAPRVGATVWLGLLIAFQLVAALVLDHFGLAGYAMRSVTPGRIAGVALLAAGVALVCRS